MARFFFLISFIIFSFPLHSQSVKKAYKLYDKGDLIKLKETLVKMDEKLFETSGKYYLYSLLYLETIDSRPHIDTSYAYIKKSIDTYPTELTKEREELEELGIFPSSLDSVKAVIDSIEFSFVSEINSISEYKRYMKDHKDSRFYDQSKKNWHSLEFKIVSNINSWQAYEEFMDNFQDAEDFLLAKSLYEELLFKEKTSDRSLFSFEKFLEDNPKTPYRDSLELLIFNYYGLSNNIKSLKNFIAKYPKSKYRIQSLNILYHSSSRDLSNFENIEMDDSFEDSLTSISNIDKENILGVYEKDGIYFISERGNKILNSDYEITSSNIFCSFEDSDFFIIEKENNLNILNREFIKIYSGPISNYIEDIGSGLIKILYDDRVEIVHKSGKHIFSGEYNDVYLVDGRYLLLDRDDKYSLYTFLGEKIFGSIFSDVFQEGSFILFENEEGKLYVTTSDKLEEQILNLNVSANFIYDDFEYFEEDKILLFSNEREELLDSDMNQIISLDSQIIEKNSFGWTATSDFGTRVVSDKISIPFSSLYDEVIYSEKYFIGKRNAYWEVRDIKEDSIVLDNLDSVSSITDSVIWYRDKMKESIYFSNSKEIILEGNYNFNVLSSKFGSLKYIKVQNEDDVYIVDMLGNKLSSAEYYYTVEKGNTFSFLSKKFNISHSEIMRMNNKKNKKLFVGEKLKVRGYVPSAVISDSLFLIEFNGKKGISDAEGSIVLEPEYDGITNLSKDNIILIKDEKFGNFNSSSKKIISPKYSSVIQPIGGNYFKVSNDNSSSIIDVEGNQLLSGFDDVKLWGDSLFILYQNQEYSIYNVLKKQKVIDFRSYTLVSNETNEFIKLQTEEGYGIYSSSHGEILMPAYSSIKSFNINGAYYFLAKREIAEANLLINLLVDDSGKVILNQALNLEAISVITCD